MADKTRFVALVALDKRVEAKEGTFFTIFAICTTLLTHYDAHACRP